MKPLQYRVSGFIWRALVAILDLNAKLYGRGSSRELCRELEGHYRPPVYIFGDRDAAEAFAEKYAVRGGVECSSTVCDGRWTVTVDDPKGRW